MKLDDLNPEQREAYDRATQLGPNNRILAITGPAGTGKTKLIQLIAAFHKDSGRFVDVAAPTGKSARRIREATDLFATTLHRLLEFTKPGEVDPKTNKPRFDSHPRKDRENRLGADVVIVDEYAMVARELHNQLLAALKPGAVLIVCGDVQQLPPIEKNKLVAAEDTAFEDLLRKFNGVVLKQVHRQDLNSGILAGAQRILRGLPPSMSDDFKMISTNMPIDNLRKLIKEADYTTPTNQIITPANHSWIGTHKLNNTLQAILFPKSRKMFSLDRHSWAEEKKQEVRIAAGDKVIVTANWYQIEGSNGELGVFNGESGIVTEIDHDAGDVTIDLGDRTVILPPVIQTVYEDKVTTGHPHRDLQLGFAVTTHKAQGSEYEEVIYVINRSVMNMCNRKNLYTALTRARKKATLIYDNVSLSASLRNLEPRTFE